MQIALERLEMFLHKLFSNAGWPVSKAYRNFLSPKLPPQGHLCDSRLHEWGPLVHRSCQQMLRSACSVDSFQEIC